MYRYWFNNGNNCGTLVQDISDGGTVGVKGGGTKKSALAVAQQSQGCQVQHGE